MTDTADYSLSLMDMLCAAMGGVALIVFLFAAMRKNLEQQEDIGSVSICELKITTDGVISPVCYVNREIGFCINDAEDADNIAYLDEENANGKFTLESRSPSSPQFRFALIGKKPEMAKIKVWLQNILPDNQLPEPDITIHYELRYNNNLLAEGDLLKNNDYISISEEFTIE